MVAFLVPRRSQHTGIADDLAHLDRPISHSNYWGIQWHRVTPSRSSTDNSSSRRCVGATVATLRSRLCTLLFVLSVALMSSLTSANGFDVIACPFGREQTPCPCAEARLIDLIMLLLLFMHLEVLFNLSFRLSLTHVYSTRTYDTRVSPD